jgi:hypothetical protein
MRGVAGNEGRAVAKSVGDQPAPVPVLPRDDVVFEIRRHPEDGSDAGVAIN